MIYSKGKIHMQANIKKKKTTKITVNNVHLWSNCGGFFGQQSQFLIDKPSITFLIAFHTCFLYEAYLNSIQATDVVVLCIKYHKIMSDCKVQIAQALHCKH